MEPAQGPGVSDSDGNAALKKWGPVVGLLAVAAIVIGIIVSSGGGDDDPDASPDTSVATDVSGAGTDSTGTDSTDPDATDGGAADSSTTGGGSPDGTEAPAGESTLPAGVMTYDEAQRLGLDIDFGERCDPETGRVKVANFFAPECYAPFDGDNGGATATGVTEDSIKIVWWQSQKDDLVLKYITDAIQNDDSNDDIEATIRGLITYYETYYETYGRSVDLVFYEGSGLVNDAVSARADAVAIAEEIQPFMVLGGPSLTNAFAEELNARGVPCVGCGPGQPYEYYVDNAPYAWGLGMGPEQANLLSAEFVGKQLVGRSADFAGDEALQETERVFGRLWVDAGPSSAVSAEHFAAEFATYDGNLAESIPFVLDPGTIQESAATAIAKLKNSGVTTVLLAVDPVSPRDFTREATAQNYFPEWVLTGNVLADTTVFARTYDQEQWAHAFGVSTLSARVAPELSGPRTIYRWFHDEDPAASNTIGVIDPSLGLLYAYLQGIGPELTMENWQARAFAADPTRTALTAPTISYGTQNRWPADLEPDYLGVDDMTLMWWDTEAEGIDELDATGTGMWQYVDGGLRYLAGAFADEPAPMFDAEGAVTMYLERPADEPVPEYDPIPAG